MGIQLGSNFTVNTALPLDDRITVADITARNAIPALRRYEGIIVYVASEQTNYQLVGGVLDAHWVELSGSGSGGGGGATTDSISLTNDSVNTLSGIGDYLSTTRAFFIDYYLYRRVTGSNKRMSGRLVMESVEDALTNEDKWQLVELARSEYGGDSGVTFSLDDVDTEKSVLVATLDDFAGSVHECQFYYKLTRLIGSSYAEALNNDSITVVDIGEYLSYARCVIVDYYLYRRTDDGFKTMSGKLFLEGVNDASTNPEKWQLFEAERSEAFGAAGVTFGLDDVDTEKSLLTITLDDMSGANHDCKFYYKKSVLTV